MSFKDILEKSSLILCEGSVIEFIRHRTNYHLDEALLNTSMLYDEGKYLLKDIYSDYINIAAENNLPIIIQTPTWRANPERCKSAGLECEAVNKSAYDFLSNIRDNHTQKSNIIIAGLMGCKGDSYDPSDALTVEESEIFHRAQSDALFNTDADLIIAATLPSLKEAIGLAKAISAKRKCDSCTKSICTGDSLAGINCMDYIISFLVLPDGRLPDGTFLADAILSVDSSVITKPIGYMVNCTHPLNLTDALRASPNDNPEALHRLIGIQGNASRLLPSELDSLESEDCSTMEDWLEGNKILYKDYGLKIFGGCCGTGPEHISALAGALQAIP